MGPQEGVSRPDGWELGLPVDVAIAGHRLAYVPIWMVAHRSLPTVGSCPNCGWVRWDDGVRVPKTDERGRCLDRGGCERRREDVRALVVCDDDLNGDGEVVCGERLGHYPATPHKMWQTMWWRMAERE